MPPSALQKILSYPSQARYGARVRINTDTAEQNSFVAAKRQCFITANIYSSQSAIATKTQRLFGIDRATQFLISASVPNITETRSIQISHDHARCATGHHIPLLINGYACPRQTARQKCFQLPVLPAGRLHLAFIQSKWLRKINDKPRLIRRPFGNIEDLV